MDAGAGRAAEPARTAPDASRPRRRAVVVTLVIVVWLAVQVAVPLAQLVDRGGKPRPRMFAWQMFTHRLEAPAERFTITTANGTREIDVTGLLGGPMRREVRYAPQVVPALCADPAILHVRVEDAEHGSTETTCR